MQLFQVARSRMPKHPQPIPPVYAPELVAEAVLFAARNPRREIIVGRGAWQAIVGNMIAPGMLDRLLAKKGYSGQQTEQLSYDPNRPDNLFDPVPGDHGAPGPFTQRSKSKDPVLWGGMHRKLVRATGVAALGLGVAAALRVARH